MKIKIINFIKNPYFIAVLVGLISLHLYREISIYRLKAPEPMVKVDEWFLVNEKGQKFGSKQLKGKVYIANYFFTRCPTICPGLIKNLDYVASFYQNKKDKINFVSFTVDPSWDTSLVLSEYKNKYTKFNKSWSFLTGSTNQVKNVIINKMKMHIGTKVFLDEKSNNDEALYEISHMGKLALFDQNGDLRGLFSTDKDGLKNILQAADLLIKLGDKA